MKEIEVTTIAHPQNLIIATCKNCKQVIHTIKFNNYMDYKKKRKQFDTYTVCPFCNKTKENNNG